ncbi:MAG: hypothetical protein KKE86_09795, partial [Planctomycetes bacterium]|nr:hypothetical protein [Planctomycetota bacterium]
MKFVLRPQRRLATQAETRIALFPFLAVLICTMGALVPLLMAITCVAKRQAEAAALAKAAEQTADVRTRLEDARWRIEMLRQSRAKTEAQMADARLQLGHLEDHGRRLREQLERCNNTLDDLDRLEQTDRRRGSETKAELRRVRAEIDAVARRIAEARNEAADRKPSYAIIPYKGPNQTHRRPIYIECRADAVVLQPEGIELTDSDFDGPLEPGNPLAAAMRAAREYMLEQPNFDAEAGEPYPMLLVRPEGINAYYAARAAMTSWGSDFGYELIGDDWNLAFQPPDPHLAQVVRQVVASARMSQARLAAAAPTHRDVRTKVVYRAKPSGGGFVREEVSSNSDAGGYRPVRPAGPVAMRRDEGRGTGGAAKRPATALAGDGYGDSLGPPTSGDAADTNPVRGANAAGGENDTRPEGYVAGRPPHEQDPSGQSSAAGSGRPLLPGQWEPTPETPPGGPDVERNDDPPDKYGGGCSITTSLTAKRGKGWGLRDAARGSVGIRRPIRIECHADRIVVLSDRGPSDNKVVPLGARVESSVDTLISA